MPIYTSYTPIYSQCIRKQNRPKLSMLAGAVQERPMMNLQVEDGIYTLIFSVNILLIYRADGLKIQLQQQGSTSFGSNTSLVIGKITLYTLLRVHIMDFKYTML